MELTQEQMSQKVEDLKNLFTDKFQEVKNDFISKRPNILVCGYTGSGKTSLVKAVLGDIVPEEKIGSGSPKTIGYDKYENENILIWDSKGLEPGQTEKEFTQTTQNFVRSRQEDPNVDNHIHLVWYTIQGCGDRITDCDLNLIRNIFNPDSVIPIITKKDLTRPRQLESLLEVLRNAGIPENRVIATTDINGGSQGCRELVDLSYQMLPEAYRSAFLDAQRVDLERKIEGVRAKSATAKKIIITATTAASGIGLIPIPLSDATLLLPVQMSMIASLAALYKLEKAMIANFALPFVTQCAGLVTATSLAKLIPGLGSLINAGVAGTLTGAMGFFVKNNFEDMEIKRIKGEPIPEFGLNFEQFRKFYQEYIKREKPAE